MELTNEEIVETLSKISNVESIDPYIDQVVRLFSEYDMTLEIRPLEVEILSLREQFSIKQLRNIYFALNNEGWQSLIMPTITGYQEDFMLPVYVERLGDAFGYEPDAIFTRELIKAIDESTMNGAGIEPMLRSLRMHLKRVSEFAEKPSWVGYYDIDISSLPTLKLSDITHDMDTALIVSNAMLQANRYITFDDNDEQAAAMGMEETLDNMNEEDRREFIDALIAADSNVQELRDNLDIFRIFGPVNPDDTLDFSEIMDPDGTMNYNVMYGGNRMFTDTTQEIDPYEEILLEDWFRGYCMECYKRIRTYHYAVREPLLNGGWVGCYCSWDCVRKKATRDQEDASCSGILALIDTMEALVNEVGIAERDYDGQEVEEEEDTSEFLQKYREVLLGERVL